MILDLIEKEGVDLGRVVICHVEARLGELAEMKSLLDRGCFVGFDLFGQTWSSYQDVDPPLPSDAARVHRIKQLADAGYADKILVSHDIDEKIFTHRFGGHGFDHILVNIVPIMRRVGITSEDIQKLLVDNPRQLLAFV